MSSLLEVAIEGESEWTQEQLDYSIIASRTSPGDGRFQVRAQAKRPSSLQFPFNTICFLEIVTAAGQGTGTGTLIAPQVVLTAKHNLMQLPAHPRCRSARALGQVRRQVTITPGADLTAGSPNHRRPAAPASMTVTGSAFRVSPDLDFGVIILPRPFQRPRQFMSLQPRKKQQLATTMTVAGYPCDKRLGTMWAHSEPVELRHISPTHLEYTLDTCPGHSGSPLWILGGRGERILVGVHTTGATTGAGRRCENNTGRSRCLRTGATLPAAAVAGTNCGVRITCDVIRQIRQWCRAAGVTAPSVLNAAAGC